MIPPEINEAEAQAVLEGLLSEEDPAALRLIVIELTMATGFWYRRALISRYLYPLFFLGGFITCYFLLS
tara:strand:+ start:4298 stop:4504 length:207 start_codon:yes stop_codon:yes gene_type:complete